MRVRADRIAVPVDHAQSRPDVTSSSSRDGWTLISWIGVTFVLMGAADVAIGLYPTAFGNAEWEFGAISGFLNALAIPTMGAFFVLSSAVVRQKPMVVRAVSISMLVVAAILVILAVLYALTIPVALRAVDRNPIILTGVKKAILKAVLFLIAYMTLYVAGGRKGLKAAKQAHRRAAASE
jgi:hypothetical protein